MNLEPHDSNSQPPREELDETLRRAVDQVRSQPLPQVEMERAVNRAQGISNSTLNRQPRSRRLLFAGAGLAAAILVGLGVWASQRGVESNERREQQMAQDDRAALKKNALEAKNAADTYDLRNIPDGTSNTILLEKRKGVTEQAPRRRL